MPLDHRRYLAGERRVTRETGVGDTRQGVLIGPTVERVTTQMLRSGVGRRTEKVPTTGTVSGRSPPGQPEISKVDVFPRRLLTGHQHVRGLHVQMDETTFVQRVQRIGDLLEQPHRTLWVHRLTTDPARQIRTVDKPHRDVQHSVEFAEVVDRHDVGVIDRRGVASLVDEPLAKLRIRPEVLADDLQRHLAAEPHIRGAVHHTHTALAEHTVDAIVAEFGPDEVPRRVASHTGRIIRAALTPHRWASADPPMPWRVAQPRLVRRMGYVISVNEHRAVITELLGNRPPQATPVTDCAGLVLAEDVVSRVALPPFDNSAMDGYALRTTDVADVDSEHPVVLPVDADIPAGRTDIPSLLPGTAHRIMTGAPIPPGADTIVKVEDTDAGTAQVRVSAAAPHGSHIRRAGEDIEPGVTALRAGTVLGPGTLGLASAVGRDTLPVHAPPRVLVVSTGTELVLPPQQLRHGQIYESNSVMLAAALRAIGCEVRTIRSLTDNVEQFRAAIEPELPHTDLLVTSGGVSAGAYEVVKDAFTGAGVDFGKVAMQPGAPQGWGTIQNVPVVTLPGNPVSVLVSFEVFLRPALLTSMGHADPDRAHTRAVLTEPLRSPPGKTQFRRGRHGHRDQHRATVAPCGGPGSHLLASFTEANCLIVLDEDVTEVPAGSEVDVTLLT